MTEITHPARIITTICMSYFVSGGLGKEHGITKPPPTKRIQEGQMKGHVSCHILESFSLESILAE